MKLTKYQKAYLLEYEWKVHEGKHDTARVGSGENTCWLHIDKEDGDVFDQAKKLLNHPSDVENIKVLVVASRSTPFRNSTVK